MEAKDYVVDFDHIFHHVQNTSEKCILFSIIDCECIGRKIT